MKILLVEAEVFHACGRTEGQRDRGTEGEKDRRTEEEGQRDRHDKANRLYAILQKRLMKLSVFSCPNAIRHEKE
jgi:hypothetical protein